MDIKLDIFAGIVSDAINAAIRCIHIDVVEEIVGFIGTGCKIVVDKNDSV